ncbi:hypothetical protein BDW22DRAFT_1243005 [Trametopsis cervina]|nr:hypothetical protein BDW22DRAFT_1243005 [Trametopsis cervina]
MRCNAPRTTTYVRDDQHCMHMTMAVVVADPARRSPLLVTLPFQSFPKTASHARASLRYDPPPPAVPNHAINSPFQSSTKVRAPRSHAQANHSLITPAPLRPSTSRLPFPSLPTALNQPVIVDPWPPTSDSNGCSLPYPSLSIYLSVGLCRSTTHLYLSLGLS